MWEKPIFILIKLLLVCYGPVEFFHKLLISKNDLEETILQVPVKLFDLSLTFEVLNDGFRNITVMFGILGFDEVI